MGFAAILQWTGLAVIFVLLAGLVGRRRLGLCGTFPLYLGTIAGGGPAHHGVAGAVLLAVVLASERSC